MSAWQKVELDSTRLHNIIYQSAAFRATADICLNTCRRLNGVNYEQRPLIRWLGHNQVMQQEQEEGEDLVIATNFNLLAQVALMNICINVEAYPQSDHPPSHKQLTFFSASCTRNTAYGVRHTVHGIFMVC